MLKSYVVDAFTDEVFKGNPAAVLFLDKFPADEMMQKIAMENKLSETAFAVKETPDKYQLRWFTPGGEIDLCGHATLATGFLVFKYGAPTQATVTFATQSGDLKVTKRGDLYEMDFPSYELKPVPVTAAMTDAFGVAPTEAYLGRDLLCVFDSAQQVAEMTPDMDKLSHLDGLLQNVTAAGDGQYDCVSRSFAPKLAVPEDPVCGSGHCHIVPYWAKKLQKQQILAYQASARSGVLHCTYEGARTKLSGHATQYSASEVFLNL